jgi:N-acetylneuraminic acid mutarotase
MSIPRSGHGCSGVPGDDVSVLVSGGTTGFGKNALAYAEIFNWETNSWKNVAEMKTGRFGHAVVGVGVGEKIFAIGGDEKNPSNILDTIEEYDVKKDAWKIMTTKLTKPRANFGYTLVPHSIFDGCIISRPLDE